MVPALVWNPSRPQLIIGLGCMLVMSEPLSLESSPRVGLSIVKIVFELGLGGLKCVTQWKPCQICFRLQTPSFHRF